jgi:hypothetical protein
MTTASGYLAGIVGRAATLAPSITTASLQRSSQPAGNHRWSPGLSGFFWGINGRIVTNAAGQASGIRISVIQWFSDRIANPGASPPDYQQFKAAAKDSAVLTFTPAGDDVHLHCHLVTWNSDWDADSFMFDDITQQMLFRVPGAGAGAPPAIQIVTFHSTGEFAFL